MPSSYGPTPLHGLPPVGDPHQNPSQGRSPHQQHFAAYGQHAPPPQERSAQGEVMALILGLPRDELSPPVRSALERLIADTGRMQEELSRRIAREDYLDLLAHRCETTKLLNRRGMARELSKFAAHLEQGGEGGTFVLMHLDGFEDVRRQHGLPAADAARRHAAEVLSTGLRLSDLVASLGGGDFAVFLAMSHGEEAVRKAGALADRLNSPPFSWNDAPHPFTIALGMAALRPDSGLRSLVAEADTELRRLAFRA